MENNKTKPQAFYTKMPSANEKAGHDVPPSSKKPRIGRPNSNKNLFAVAGLVFFIIVALTGVLIAQKQVSRDGESRTFAPNAPDSQPQASSDDHNECATKFFVPKGDAKCNNKIALTDFSANDGERIDSDHNFNIGDSFVFRIRVSASNDTAGNVKVVDRLPATLKFIEDKQNSDGIINDGRDIVANLGEMKKDEKKDIEFRVRVISEGIRETNSAKVTTNDDDNTESSCSYRFNTVTGTVECIDKEMYDGDPALGGVKVVPEGSALTRGQEYVYYITVKARNQTNGRVEVRDVIPSGLDFVRALPNSEQYIDNEPGQNTVVANLGQLSDEEVSLGFVVKVTDNPGVGDFVNTAEVYINNDGGVLGISTDNLPDVPSSWQTLDTKDIPDCPNGWREVASGKGNGNDEHDNPLFEWQAPSNGTAKFIGEDNDPKEDDDLGGHGVTKVGVGKWLVPTQDPDDDGWGYESTLFTVQQGDRYEAFVGDDSGEMAICFSPDESGGGDACEVRHTIVPIGTAQCLEKQAFTDFGGAEIPANEEVEAGQEFVYRIKVQANNSTTGDVVVVDILSSDLRFVEDTRNTEGIVEEDGRISIDYGVIEDNDVRTITFKVRVVDYPSGDSINNVATVTTNGETSHECELPLDIYEEEVSYDCNESCETDANCQTADFDYVCYGSNDDRVCRLGSNPGNTNCDPAGTPTPTPTPPTAPPTTPPPVTPAPGCNDECSHNGDCSNYNHICATTSDGSNRCRLEDFPESDTCTNPIEEVQTQPELPVELPETGPQDWLNWFKAGLVTLGVGTALFLLL